MKKVGKKKYSLIVLAMCGLTASCLGVCTSSVGVFYGAVTEDLGILKGTFAMHSTLALLTTAVVSLFVPKLLERFSLKKLILAGTILAAGATALMAFSRHIALFYALGVLRGVGCALFSAVPITLVLNNWFKKGIGAATSITFSFSGVSGAVCSPILSACIGSFGWEKAYLVMALFILGFNILAILLPFKLSPAEEGLRAYGDDGAVTVSTKADSPKAGNSRYVPVLSAAFLVFSAAYTLVNALTNVPQYYTVYVGEVGLDASVGAMLLSCAMVGNVLSKLVLGFLNDKFGAVKSCSALLVVNLISLVGIGLLPVYKSVAVIGAASVLFGTSYALASVGVPLLTRHYFGVENYSHLFPVISFMLNVGVSLSLTLMGYVYDYTGRYVVIIAAGAIIDLLVLAATLLVARIRKQPKENASVSQS